MNSAQDVFNRAKQTVECLIHDNPATDYSLLHEMFAPELEFPLEDSAGGYIIYKSDIIVRIFIHKQTDYPIQVEIHLERPYDDEERHDEDAAEDLAIVKTELSPFLTFCRQRQIEVRFVLTPEGSLAGPRGPQGESGSIGPQGEATPNNRS